MPRKKKKLVGPRRKSGPRQKQPESSAMEIDPTPQGTSEETPRVVRTILVESATIPGANPLFWSSPPVELNFPNDDMLLDAYDDITSGAFARPAQVPPSCEIFREHGSENSHPQVQHTVTAREQANSGHLQTHSLVEEEALRRQDSSMPSRVQMGKTEGLRRSLRKTPQLQASGLLKATPKKCTLCPQTSKRHTPLGLKIHTEKKHPTSSQDLPGDRRVEAPVGGHTSLQPGQASESMDVDPTPACTHQATSNGRDSPQLRTQRATEQSHHLQIRMDGFRDHLLHGTGPRQPAESQIGTASA